MSTDFSIRPVGAPVAAPIVSTVGDAARGGVATQLPPSQTVTPTDAGASTRNDLQSSSDFISRQAFFDQAAASVVFQVVDGKTDRVVQQFPDEAVLRRRAYFHALDLEKDTPTRAPATDLKA